MSIFKWFKRKSTEIQKADIQAQINKIIKSLPGELNTFIKVNSQRGMLDTNEISDGYHTYGELYNHRIELWITVCRLVQKLFDETATCSQVSPVWRTRVHSDGSVIKGWFLLGVYTEAGKQITYHLPDNKWLDCEFADILEDAPEFDGHTSLDVLKRLKTL